MKLILLMAAIALTACSKSAGDDAVKFDGIETSVITEQSTPFIGFGYNQYPPDLNADGSENYVWTDERFAMMEERIRAINPGLVRMPVLREWYDDDFVAGNYDWDSPQMKSFYKFMDLYKEMNVKVLTGWWHVTDYATDKDGYRDMKNVQAFCEFIDYMINTKGYTNIAYVQPSNEPYGTYTQFSDWSNFIARSYEYCQSKGYPTDRFCGPDSWDDWVGKGAQANSKELSSYNFHFYFDGTKPSSENMGLYDQLMGQMNQVTKYQPGNTKPVVCAECGAINGSWLDWPANKPEDGIYSFGYQYAVYMADFAIQAMNAGVASCLSWGLHGFDQNKDAGMWNNTGNWGGLKLRPLYYVWSLMCRYFPDGATILNMSRQTAKIKVGGCKIGASDYSFVICNRASYADFCKINLPANSKQTYYIYNFTESSQGDGTQLSLNYEKKSTDKNVVVEVLKNSVTIVTTLAPID